MKRIINLLLGLVLIANVNAQNESKFEFTDVYNIKTTPVKSQDRTGTCWAFSTTSFVETEVIRLGGPELDLSEMYFVRYVYPKKAQKYVMLHGKGNFSQGGLAHDVMNSIRAYGMATEEAYPGRREVSKPHNHTELELSQKVLLDNFISQRSASPNPVWYEVLGSVLDNYLGEIPEKVDGKTPQEFAAKMKINPDDYIELTSYTNYPYYKLVDLEIPDNWSHDRFYNLPLDELMEVINNALANGYSMVWDGDVSEKFFSHKEGVALVPADESKGFEPQAEKSITPAIRQEAFLSWQSTDDHLMHITGMVKDQNGTVYYKTKNSWGEKSNAFGGYLNMSESYVRLHTVSVMIHKDALPKSIAKKIKVK
ncbi:C1 family peptidase [Carboxylicivirga linearis]|uniref:Aminopeptidase n=1 Tax=Carboxylicivirga linearis TaxID=1628157 RepID=A0ABS5JTP7_9BACT|nr:C1 family peptidase [Carboxylicivirga linearis]MBS2098242.1 aminopeptidase [Carboxylicivirga linearis]